jgi:hypothetical protein
MRSHRRTNISPIDAHNVIKHAPATLAEPPAVGPLLQHHQHVVDLRMVRFVIAITD